jgi:chromosome segregation ATPase
MNWLREHMRDQLRHASSGPGRNILDFPADTPATSRYDTSSALDLVSQAAEVIRDIQDRATESEARAKALAESAIEKLQLAEARIHSAEAARGLAQGTLSKLSARLHEAEQELARTQSRIAAADAQLEHMRAAETRAFNSEKALNQIEDAIRTQLVGLKRSLPGSSVRAA